MPSRNLRSMQSSPTVVGMGLLALDIVFAQDRDRPSYFAGGTCGNVLTILNYLGWRSRPIARLGPGAAADYVVEDLETFGVLTDLIKRDSEGSTPVIVQRIRRRNDGELYHTFSWRCPTCGAHLPGYKAVLSSAADQLRKQLGGAKAFFFDRVSRAVLIIAAELRRRGAVIIFEPSSVGDHRLFREAYTVAHIVKYSHERLRDIADVPFGRGERDRVLLEIETLGRSGLRYRSRLAQAPTRNWTSVAAFSREDVKDAAGSGDWCTAGLIHSLARGGVLKFRGITTPELVEAMRLGQALAAWNCRFEGARGGMYQMTKEQFGSQIQTILRGAVLEDQGLDGQSDESPLALHSLCPSCDRVRRPKSLAASGRGA